MKRLVLLFVLATVLAVPAWAAMPGGKIRLPAPKNMEKRVSPTRSRSLPRSFMVTPPLEEW